MPKAAKRNPEELVNQTTAARMIGVSRPTIHAMVAREELEGVMIAGRVFVKLVSVEHAAKERKKRAA